MNARRFLLAGFVAMALAQLAVPASMIARREWILRTGRQFRFRTAPVDPYDAFRGRYVAVRVMDDWVPLAPGTEVERGRGVFATISEGPDGLARLEGAALDRPAGEAYLEAEVRRVENGRVRLAFPFDRFYLTEKAAPAAEAAYRRASAREARAAAALVVRVRSGHAVLEDLEIEGTPIGEYLRRAR